MPRNLILTAVVGALACVASVAWAQDNDRPVDKTTDYIKAEVRGILRFEEGRGYFISVKSAEKPERECRVWLRISEDKVTARRLAPLKAKEVLAQGDLKQMPESVQANVPPNGLYMDRFEVKGVEAK